MEIKQPPDERRMQLIPIVTYAAERRIASGKLDYWDYATLLEAAILIKEKDKAMEALSSALTLVREEWEAETKRVSITSVGTSDFALQNSSLLHQYHF